MKSIYHIEQKNFKVICILIMKISLSVISNTINIIEMALKNK